ncbi:hypothetical protein ACFWMT_23105 [Streptomyces sp. NPDC058368]|uniref:hypothetical protein n=1 Tax=Streptomyces sp. NPDC058368 TaxID=3346461 RepID=UPI00364ED739
MLQPATGEAAQDLLGLRRATAQGGGVLHNLVVHAHGVHDEREERVTRCAVSGKLSLAEPRRLPSSWVKWRPK